MITIINRKYCFGISAVLGLICLLSLCLSFFGAFNNILADALAVVSGYCASFFCCIGLADDRKQKIMRGFFIGLFVFYIMVLIDFTLIDDGFGRNILASVSADKLSFSEYTATRTNFVPFATVRLFINGYINDKLTLSATVVNILGNFTAFMPLPFFVLLLGSQKSGLRIFGLVLLCVISIELLQLLLRTGACDIDDVILNTAGAMLFYFVSRSPEICKIFKKLTFGVWDLE